MANCKSTPKAKEERREHTKHRVHGNVDLRRAPVRPHEPKGAEQQDDEEAAEEDIAESGNDEALEGTGAPIVTSQ